ncbi:MAG TPA: FAD-dependent oxidoreductase [Gammaproteobacteria bacterium]|nr:FAD-dependent oxidoreductase [Gammaproteobacteria bacterium]
MSEPYDLAIIGAGIHGAGVAQAAAAAGYSVLVLERTGPAAGTSSRSSKLIHGGLRYLEQLQLKLVWECLHERELLLKLAPDLVKIKPFYIPVYGDTRRRPWQLYAGLGLYSLLAGPGHHARFRTLPRNEWDRLGGLDTAGLQQVFQYWDGQTDDAALTKAVLRSAMDMGAELLAPVEFLGADLEAQGAWLRYKEGGQDKRCRARVLVNAAGPWVSQAAAKITPFMSRVQGELVQGAHVLLDIPSRDGIFYMEVPKDGRAVFLMPWKGISLVGTTETVFAGRDPGSVAPTEQERDYLKAVVQRYFPTQTFTEVAAFAGLRVLPRDATRPFDRGRELILETDRGYRPRAINLYGGKLTSYRADSLKVLRKIRSSLPSRKRRGDTARLPLRPAD